MKNTSKFLSALAGLLLLAVPALRAADDTSTPPPPAGDQPKHEHRERGPGAMMERAAKELGLTAEQEAKWKEIGQAERAAAKPIMDDQSLSKEDRRAKLKELNKTYADQRRSLLTPDQQAKFDERRAKRSEHGPRGERGPKPDKKD